MVPRNSASPTGPSFRFALVTQRAPAPRNKGRYCRQFFFFLVSRKTHGNAKKMRWVLLSPGVMFREVATLVHLIESSKPAASA